MVTAAGTSVPSRSRPVTNGAYYAASVLYNAGFRGWPLTVMTAIAGVESNWSPNDVNNDPSTGDYSVGLTQVNYFGDLLASRTQQFGSPQSLQANPDAQAAATYQLAGGNALSGLSNWGGGYWNGQNGSSPTFTESGYASSWAAHLPQAAAAVAQVGTFGPAPASATAQVGNWPGTSGGPAVNAGGFSSVIETAAQIGAPYGCGLKKGGNSGEPNQIFTIPHTSAGLTFCNVKAILGGTFLVMGGALMLGGLTLVVVTGLGSKLPGPLGAIGGAVVGDRAGKASAAAKAPSASEMSGSPSRRGSASSRAKPRSVGRDPDDSFTEENEKLPSLSEQRRQRAA